MTDLQARAEAAADAMQEARAYLGQLKKAEAHAAFGSASTSVRVKDAPELIRIMSELIEIVALQSEGWRPIAGSRRDALMLERVEDGRWSLVFDFGKGDEACMKMRALSDAIRALPLPAPPDGEGV